jgi:hypothetical protein
MAHAFTMEIEAIDLVWLIRQHPHDQGLPPPQVRWQLILDFGDTPPRILGEYTLPHLAAVAVAEQRTGDRDWDTIPLPMAAGLHDLSNWARTQTPA